MACQYVASTRVESRQPRLLCQVVARVASSQRAASAAKHHCCSFPAEPNPYKFAVVQNPPKYNNVRLALDEGLGCVVRRLCDDIRRI